MGLLAEKDDQRGKIVRRDERPDGTEIWLVCEEAEGPDPASVGFAPDDDDEWWPTGYDELPTLVVDTTALNGVYRFGLEQFIEIALGHMDMDVIVLGDHNAEAWGLRRERYT